MRDTLSFTAVATGALRNGDRKDSAFLVSGFGNRKLRQLPKKAHAWREKAHDVRILVPSVGSDTGDIQG